MGTPEQAQEPQPGEEEPSPFRKEPERTLNNAKYSEVEGHGLPSEAGIWRRIGNSVGELAREFAGSVPELPVFPRAWWNKADVFLRGNKDFYARLKEGYRLLKRSNTSVFQEAAEQVEKVLKPLREATRAKGEKFDANSYARLRKLQQQARNLRDNSREPSPAMVAEIRALQERMEADPYVLFSRLVMYLDFQWRKRHIKNKRGEGITLPGNLNADEIDERLAQIKQKIAASPYSREIAVSLQKHVELVRGVADDLRTRELLAQEILTNDVYFPHLLVDKTSGRLARVKIDTAQDFRGYLIDPVGSNRPVETDYVRAMYYHLVQVGAHNRRADIVEAYFKPYNIMEEVANTAKAMSKERGEPINWQQAFNERFLDQGYRIFSADAGNTLVPGLAIDREKLAQRLGAVIGEGNLHKELAKLGVKGIRILPEDIRESLQSGGKEYWVVPERVAEALHGMEERATATDGRAEKFFSTLQKLWKVHILFAPWHWFRYEFNNLTADVEKVLSSDPAMLSNFRRANDELRALRGGGAISPEMRSAIKLGVVNSVTASEVEALPELSQFEFMTSTPEKIKQQLIGRLSTATTLIPQLFSGAMLHVPGLRMAGAMLEVAKQGGSNVRMSAMREGIFRYAKFLTDLERMKNGARPVYGGAYWRDVEAITDTDEHSNDANYKKAAEISLKTFGDYDDISVRGEQMRKFWVPFYSWMEINFRYHANTFRNLKDAVAANHTSKAEAAKAGARAGAVFAAGMTRRAAAGFITRLALPYMAILAWNNSGDREEIEEELSEEDKRRFHIILGRKEDGTPLIVYTPTALSDVLRWFSGPEFARVATDYFKGNTDLATATGEWTNRIVPDFLNNAFGSVSPLYKLSMVNPVVRLNPFPDVLNPTKIPMYDVRRAIIANITDHTTADVIERVVNKEYVSNKDFSDWFMQTVLQVRRRDPEQWAFYQIKEKAAEFWEERTGKPPGDFSYDADDQQALRNFRRAIYKGDIDTALRFYDILLTQYGYTAERFSRSVHGQDPLILLSNDSRYGRLRSDFIDSLSENELAMLERAYRYYERMKAFSGDERRLFPRQGDNLRQAEAYRARFQPRPDLIQREIEAAGNLSDEELQRRVERDLRSARRLR